MRNPCIFDGRNLLDAYEMKQLGYKYHSIGRQKKCSSRINQYGMCDKEEDFHESKGDFNQIG
jgi:hypothetical protein